MKKLFAIILTLTLLSAAAIPSFAQGRDRRINRSQTYYGGSVRNGRAYDSRSYDSRSYNSRSYYDYRNRSVWDKHRDKITVAGGAGAGALLGAIIGGRKGAVIGALTGAGGSALYTYKLRDRNRYRRY